MSRKISEKNKHPKDRLKELRKYLGLTQEKMAVAIGLNQANIRDLELGKVKISTLHALAMQNIFDLSPDWLLTGKGKMLCEDHKKQKMCPPLWSGHCKVIRASGKLC